MSTDSTDDLFHVVDSPSSSPSNKKITVSNVMNKVPTFLGLNSTETLTGGALTTTTTPILSIIWKLQFKQLLEDY